MLRRMSTIAERLGQLKSEIPKTKLIAVSKTKPVEDLVEAYQAGQRDFGENYPNELKQKAADAKLAELCPDLRWHFIGTLQKKSLNHVLKAEKLVSIQTITSLDMIDQIDKRLQAPLDVMLQINTSREEQKGGFLEDDDVIKAIEHIGTKNFVKFQGLMTIGAAENSKLSAETGQDNPDFTRLVELKKVVSERCNIEVICYFCTFCYQNLGFIN